MVSFLSSSSSCTSSAYDSSSIAQARSQMVDRLFKKADTNGDGKISKDELTQAFGSDSVTIGSGNKKDGGNGLYQQLSADIASNGYATKQDVADALDKLQQQRGGAPPPPPDGAQGTGGPSGGGGGGAGAAAGAGGGASGVTVSTDPADTNQDGKVSMQEKLAYLLKQQETQSEQQSQVSTYA